MSKDILSEYDNNSSGGSRATNDGRQEIKDIPYSPPYRPGYQPTTGPGGGTNHGTCGTQGKR